MDSLKTLIAEIRVAADAEQTAAENYQSAARMNNYTRELVRVHREHRAMLGSLAHRLSALITD